MCCGSRAAPARRGPSPDFCPRRSRSSRRPLRRAIGATLIAFFLVALGWACLGHVDIIATAQGKVVPTGRIKTVQPLEAGIVATIDVRDGDKVAKGDVLIALDRTVSTAERN